MRSLGLERLHKLEPAYEARFESRFNSSATFILLHQITCTKFYTFHLIYGNGTHHSFLCLHPASLARLFPIGLCFHFLTPATFPLPPFTNHLDFVPRAWHLGLSRDTGSPVLNLLRQGLPPSIRTQLKGGLAHIEKTFRRKTNEISF